MNSIKNKKLAVVIASIGRPSELTKLIELLKGQSVEPSQIIISVTSNEDVSDIVSNNKKICVVYGDKGLPKQRNNGLKNLNEDVDYILFIDDDYIPSKYCVENLINKFESDGDLIGITGVVLADGITGPGISLEEAEKIIENYDSKNQSTIGDASDSKVQSLYGCNMAFRFNKIRGVFFDESLPLYGWQEDFDFSYRVGNNGKLIKSSVMAGVHQGTKGARISGVRFGYSQISNPIYLAKKGSMPWMYALKLISKNMIANHAKVLFPESWVDRIGRCKGNWLSIYDLLMMKNHPENILRR
nr:glycosyltransferase [uncultured Amphritea sp.]